MFSNALYRSRIALKNAFRNECHRATAERLLDTCESGPAKGIILEKNCDAREREVFS